jgi:hypothetical protein
LTDRSTVRRKQRKACTIEGGFYEISGVTEGNHEVCATINEEAEAKSTVNKTIVKCVQTSKDEIVDCDFFFEQEACITGTVYSFGTPKGGVSVRACRNTVERFLEVKNISEQDGTYILPGLSPGLYDLAAWFSDNERVYCYERKALVESRGAVIDLHLCEKGFGEVYGYIYKNNKPVSNYRVFLISEYNNDNTTTDMRGTYRFSKVPAGKIGLHALLISFCYKKQ